MDLLFIALGILVVWYVVSSLFHKGHASEYKEFAKEQERNRARKEARRKETEQQQNANEGQEESDEAK